MGRRWRLVALGLAAALSGTAARAAAAPVREVDVRAEVGFLAGEALAGRGSATRDEAIAAAYVASLFQGFGLTPAPGMGGWFQTARVVKPRLVGAARLSVEGREVGGTTLLFGANGDIAGPGVLFTDPDSLKLPAAEVVVAASPASPILLTQAALSKHVKLLILAGSPGTDAYYRIQGGTPQMAAYLEGAPAQGTAVITVPPAEMAALSAAARAGGRFSLALPRMETPVSTTTNVIGYLAGTDPGAGVILVSAHLDHLGVLANGTVMPGANDDASGMVGVIELARALAAGQRPRRGVLFVGFGSEEIGQYGAKTFVAHPPVPLAGIAAAVELEMIGLPDPKLPKGSLFLTGSDRSTLRELLVARGAPLAADTHPEQHYFERSDNYPLAQAGVVAHTAAGWTTPPSYHQPSDTAARLDFGYLVGAIRALAGPIRRLADSDARPAWAGAGRPPAGD